MIAKEEKIVHILISDVGGEKKTGVGRDIDRRPYKRNGRTRSRTGNLLHLTQNCSIC